FLILDGRLSLDGACGILRCSILCLGTTAGSQHIGRGDGSKDGEQGRGSVADANCPVRVGVRHQEIADACETSRCDRAELYAEQERYEVEDGPETEEIGHQAEVTQVAIWISHQHHEKDSEQAHRSETTRQR